MPWCDLRIAGAVKHDFHDIGIERFRRVVDRMARRGDRSVDVDRQQVCHFANKRRLEQRFVALNVDDDGAVVERKGRRGFGQAIGAGRMVGAGHDCIDAVRRDRPEDSLIVGRNDDPRGTPGTRALGDAHDHGLAANVRQWLSGQPRRCVAGGNKDGEQTKK